MIFTSLEPSTRPDKKYMIMFNEPKKLFILDLRIVKHTCLDHKDKKKRFNYLQRHYPNENWDNPLSAGALSVFLLWGSSTDLETNLKEFLRRFNVR